MEGGVSKRTNARIASLLRELADAFDELDTDGDKKKRPRIPRERVDHAAEDAMNRVRRGLRRQGVVS